MKAIGALMRQVKSLVFAERGKDKNARAMELIDSAWGSTTAM